MRTPASHRILLGCSLLWLPPVIAAGGQEARISENESYPLVVPYYVPARITSVEPDGTLRLVSRPLPAGPMGLATEGFYLIASPQHLPGLASAPSPMPRQVAPAGLTKGARRAPPAEPPAPAARVIDGLVRVEVTEVGENNALTARAGAEAANLLKAGDVVVLVRPARMTTARIRALPAVIPLLKESDPRVPRSLRAGIADTGQSARSIRSVNNLRQIGLAMHNFHTTMGNFPPGVVFGPDGKPWHSWRVLILPYLGETQLFNAYDFTQPWDGPKNRALLDRMPAVYRDPQNVDTTGSHTHYAALVGERTAFPPRGSRITVANGTASPELYKGLSLAHVTDGSSNTIGVVPVDPARKIPWTKPEDIAVGPDLPALGRPGGIFTPGRVGGTGVAPVLFLDGSVRTLSDGTDLATLRALTTINGGEIIMSNKIVGPPSVRGQGLGRPPHLYLIGEGRDVSAMIGPASGP